MAALNAIAIDPALSGADKIRSLFNQKGMKISDADSAANGGNGDGLVTKDELSKLVRGSISALDLDSFGGMDALKQSLDAFGTDNKITDSKAYDIKTEEPGATTDSGKTGEADQLTQEISDLKDQIKKLEEQLGKPAEENKKAEDGEHHHRHHHHRHHEHHGLLEALFNPFKILGA